MAPGKKVQERTVVILDVESASVGAALARLSKGTPPKLLCETRVPIPLMQTIAPAALAQAAERAARTALTHTSTVAARLRQAASGKNAKTIGTVGEVSEALVFLAPPWSMLGLGKAGAQWQFEPALTAALTEEIEALYGAILVTFQAFGNAAAQTTGTLFPQQPYILCAVSGELAELALVQNNTAHAWASIPLGSRTVVRTLQTHGGLSSAEAHSALRLGEHPALLAEPLAAAAQHFTNRFKDAVGELLPGAAASGVLVVAEERVAEWFARALAADPSLLELFPMGGVVRPLRRSHLMPYLAAHAPEPDLHLMLEALFLVYT